MLNFVSHAFSPQFEPQMMMTTFEVLAIPPISTKDANSLYSCFGTSDYIGRNMPIPLAIVLY